MPHSHTHTHTFTFPGHFYLSWSKGISRFPADISLCLCIFTPLRKVCGSKCVLKCHFHKCKSVCLLHPAPKHHIYISSQIVITFEAVQLATPHKFIPLLIRFLCCCPFCNMQLNWNSLVSYGLHVIEDATDWIRFMAIWLKLNFYD